jgi:hypothetical protein
MPAQTNSRDCNSPPRTRPPGPGKPLPKKRPAGPGSGVGSGAADVRQPACRAEGLAALAAAMAGPAPPTPLDDLPVPALSADALDNLLDRIDAALYERRIDIDEHVFGALLMALLPDDFEVPDPPAGPTDTPPGPAGVALRGRTRAAALRSARVRVYVERCRAHVHLYHAADARGDQFRRGLAVAPAVSGKSQVQVAGWADEGAGRRRRRA